MSPPFKFYYDLVSPPSRALLTMFKIAKVPFEAKPIALRKLEHRSEEYINNVNRFGKTPTLVDGTFKLTEAPAILRYVVDKYKVDDLWYPADARDRARVDEYLSWTHNNIRMHSGLYFFAKFRDPIMFGMKTEPSELKRLHKAVQKQLDEFEVLWTETAYVAGNKLTFADVLATCDLEQLRMTGVDPLDNRPKTTAWFNRTRKQLEPFFSEHHKFVYIAAEMMRNKQDEEE